MKKISLLLLFMTVVSWTAAAELTDHMYCRAMNDEMQRALTHLRLKDHAKPYYIAYWLWHDTEVDISADMGTLAPSVHPANDAGNILGTVFVSVGSDKQDNLGFGDSEKYTQGYYNARLPYRFGMAPGYAAIRQQLWQMTDKAYLQAADLYKKKQNYKRKKNITATLPDVVAEPPAQFAEEITPFVRPDVAWLEQEVSRISSLGKTLDFVESFEAQLYMLQSEKYFLNSRGAFAQQVTPWIIFRLNVSFRQPDGKTSEVQTRLWLKDASASELARAEKKALDLLAQVRQAYGAKSGSAYIGPVLLKPRAAADFIQRAVLEDMQNSKPFLWAYSDDDSSAGKLYKKRDLRVSTDLLTIYDRPLTRYFDGVNLMRFMPVDSEGVAAQNLILVQNGRVQQFPLTQRPMDKNHHSNGHAFIDNLYGPRERLTNVFVEPKEQFTDEQMEEKLLERCRELGLDYGYILHTPSPSGDLGIERIYTQDGRKETVLNLKWDGNFFTQRDLRSVRAVGGNAELAANFSDLVLVTPSILMDEVELVPQEHKPHRKPFISKPK